MNIQEFKESLTNDGPPKGLSLALQALWQDGQDDWEGAHTIAQADESQDGSWVHAYLHRKEGDLSNAGYWYRRANQPVAKQSLDEEWTAIAETLLKK